MRPENKESYVVLLLQKTRLSRRQISELTGFTIKNINRLSDIHRPRSINDKNVLEGRAPDVEAELLKLQDELIELRKMEEAKEQHRKSQPSANLSFNYEVSSMTEPSTKEVTLNELKKLKDYVEQLDSNYINLYLKLNGRGL